MACAFGANLMMTCYGLVVPSSGFMIPQLEDPDSGFGISVEEGSWLGITCVILICSIFKLNNFSKYHGPWKLDWITLWRLSK